LPGCLDLGLRHQPSEPAQRKRRPPESPRVATSLSIRMKSFSDKVVIVTGASSGIGLEIARLFHREGAKLVLAGRDPARLEAAARELGGALEVQTDVTQDS